MKKQCIKKGFALFGITFAVIVVVALVFFALFSIKKCNEIRTFAIGNVDSRFKISAGDVQKVAEESALKWNNQSDKILLKYDKNSALKIDLIYDQRQAEVDQFNLASDTLQKSKDSVESTKGKFDQMLTTFQADLKTYNSEVSYWNKKGGATGTTYSDLEQTRTDLNKRRDQLISMSKNLNMAVDGFNSDLQNLQNDVDSKKNIIITQGLFIPAENKIEIYTFGNKEELRLVLIHELGHALGFDHGQDPSSIMYYLLGDQDLSNPTLLAEDIAMIGARCDLQKPNFYRSIFQFSPIR